MMINSPSFVDGNKMVRASSPKDGGLPTGMRRSPSPNTLRSPSPMDEQLNSLLSKEQQAMREASRERLDKMCQESPNLNQTKMNGEIAHSSHINQYRAPSPGSCQSTPVDETCHSDVSAGSSVVGASARGCLDGGFINGCRSDSRCQVKVVNPKQPKHGIFSAFTSRIRQWLGSKRKYEISPRDNYVKGSSTISDICSKNKDWDRRSKESGVFTEFPTSGGAQVDLALNRCGPGHLSPRLPNRLPNGYAAATAAESGKIPLQRSPVFRHDAKRLKSPTTPVKGTSVLSMLQAAISGKTSPTKDQAAISGFDSRTKLGISGDNRKTSTTDKRGDSNRPMDNGFVEICPPSPRKMLGVEQRDKGEMKKENSVDIKINIVDVSGQKPSPLSPSASRLLASSRRHLLRQSRSKLKGRVTSLVTSLVPAPVASLMHQPLTTTISAPPQPQAGPEAALATECLRRCHSWPLPRRKAIPGKIR